MSNSCWVHRCQLVAMSLAVIGRVLHQPYQDASHTVLRAIRYVRVILVHHFKLLDIETEWQLKRKRIGANQLGNSNLKNKKQNFD